MKKIGINIIIALVISITLIIINIIVIKPNMTYMIGFNGKIYVSQNNSTYNVDNDVISFLKQDKKIQIESKIEKDNSFYEDKVVFDPKTGYTVLAIEGDTNIIIDANISFSSDKYKTPIIKSATKELSYEEMMICMKYANLLNAKINGIDRKDIDKDKINVASQKIICSILSVFIGVILSFLAYPVILYEKLKENQKLAVISIALTFILCISSGFYIFFTLK